MYFNDFIKCNKSHFTYAFGNQCKAHAHCSNWWSLNILTENGKFCTRISESVDGVFDILCVFFSVSPWISIKTNQWNDNLWQPIFFEWLWMMFALSEILMHFTSFQKYYTFTQSHIDALIHNKSIFQTVKDMRHLQYYIDTSAKPNIEYSLFNSNDYVIRLGKKRQFNLFFLGFFFLHLKHLVSKNAQ